MMERALKERIIGAVVLVLFVVLVVPVFLDGPPVEGETVSQRVLLPGQEGQEIKTVVLDRERSVPIPAAEVTAQSGQAPSRSGETRQVEAVEVVTESGETRQVKAVEVVTEQAAPPAATPAVASADKSPPPPTASTTGMWAVQLGSFAVRENAEKLQASLRKQGYAAFLSQVTAAGKLQYRVRIGPQKDRAGAETTAAQLVKANHRGQVVPHP